jgi:single-strand DNA-binding protein
VAIPSSESERKETILSLNTNIVIVTGNLTADPVHTKREKNGETLNFCEFRVAVNDGKDAQDNDRAYFFTVKTFGKTAVNAAEYLSVGKKVAVTGTLRQERWEDSETKTNREKVIIAAQRVEFLTPRGAQNGSTSVESDVEAPQASTEDIPF